MAASFKRITSHNGQYYTTRSIAQIFIHHWLSRSIIHSQNVYWLSKPVISIMELYSDRCGLIPISLIRSAHYCFRFVFACLASQKCVLILRLKWLSFLCNDSILDSLVGVLANADFGYCYALHKRCTCLECNLQSARSSWVIIWLRLFRTQYRRALTLLRDRFRENYKYAAVLCKWVQHWSN